MARCFKKQGNQYKLVVELEDGRYIFPEKSKTKDEYKQIYGVKNFNDGKIGLYYSDDSSEIIKDTTRITTVLKNINNRLCKKTKS